MKLISYVRVSTDGQLDGFGPAAQEEACRLFGARSEHEILDVVLDSISGKAVDRPGFRSVLDRIDSGEIDGIVVARFDRLARQLTVQEALLALVWGVGGRVFTADTGEVLQDDPDDPMRTAMRQMAGVMAEFDRSSTVSRLKRGRQAKAALGMYAGGGVPFGAMVADQYVVENPTEKAALAFIRRSFVETNNLSATARLANGAGFRTRNGCLWTATQVRRIVK